MKQVERESSKEWSVSFLWTNESFSQWNCLSKNSTLFSARRIRAPSLFWTNQGSEVSEDTWGTFRTLWSKRSTFLKRKFCIYKIDVFYILISACRCHVLCARFYLRELSYANCFLVLTYGLLNNNFQKLSYSDLLLLIDNINSKNDHESTDRETGLWRHLTWLALSFLWRISTASKTD